MNPLFDPSSPEYNHVMQILNACKCLFVSHRKIAIYLQSLNAEKKKKSATAATPGSLSQSGVGVLNESTNTIVNNDSINSTLSAKIISMDDTSNSLESSINTKTCKLTLSDIRIPLSWKYSEHLKAAKNSG